ncbi:hypothetical protein [Flammeovirga pacifica]|uniref:Uncharacterized protein n=1 Tax=Flammeovirga pacifica TaxID=915059 RepID=A0A1S1YV52_FLAPC|nr:hypothetical protein [Flammeovirga pacifica]OHX64897.1 hypothetical protein NH26_00330 [Flammeovirga pacifica]
MIKYFIALTVVVQLLFLSINTYGQGSLNLSTSFNGQAEQKVDNNATLSFGNPGISSSILYFTIILNNTSTSEELIISDILSNGSHEIGYYPTSGDLSIAPNTKGFISCFYSASSDILRKENTLTFKTSDPTQSSISFHFVTNEDDGYLSISSSDFPIHNQTIDIGDVTIGSTTHFTIGNGKHW